MLGNLQHAHTALSFVGEILSLRYCHDFGAMGEFNLIFSPVFFGVVSSSLIRNNNDNLNFMRDQAKERMTKRQNSPPQHEQTVQQQQRICVWLRRARSIQIKLMRFLFIVNWEIFPLSLPQQQLRQHHEIACVYSAERGVSNIAEKGKFIFMAF